jgi:shikimate kinase
VPRHLILIGLSGAGKSAAGQDAADRLGARCTDVDLSLELREGRSIAQIFAQQGEAGFRRLERDLVAEALAAPPQVIVPGAGWAAQPGNLQAAGGAFVIHLAVSPAQAALRLEGTSDRPLLRGDMEGRLSALLEARRPWYERAHATVETDGRSRSQVADAIAELARREAGWSGA